MAIRELVTSFTFQTDLGGLNDYNRALDKTKVATEKAFDLSKLNAGLEKLSSVAFKLTNMMGLTFATTAIDQLGGKLFDYVKEIANGAKEANRLNAQIALIVGNTTQAASVQETLFNLAQKTGMEYKDIAEMSKGILVAGKEQNIPVEKTTDAISNMVLALKTGKASAQETAEAVGSLEQSMRMGKIGPRTIGRLIQAPGLGQFLADQLSGGDLGKLRAKVKAGLNIKDLLEGLAKPNADLNAKVSKLPFTIARAFTMIKNEMTSAYSAIMKVTAGFGGMGKMVWNTFSFAKGAILGFIDTLGGLRNTIEIVGIALALALGPLLIRNIILATASLVEMAVASWAVWLPWIAIGVAIGVAALAIQDFMLWMEGGKNKTILGDLLGPFDAFKKSIENLPFMKILTGIKDFFSGDFGKGFTEIKDGFASIETPAQKVATIVGIIGAGFIAWEALSFVGIIGALGKLAAAFVPVRTAAAEAAVAIEATGAVAGAKGGAAVVPGAGPRATKPSTGRLNTALQLGLLGYSIGENTGLINSGVDKERLSDAALGGSLGMLLGLPGTIAGAIGGALWKKPDVLPDWLNKGLGDTIGELIGSIVASGKKATGAETAPSIAPSADQAGVPQSGAMPPSIDAGSIISDFLNMLKKATPDVGTQAPSSPSPNDPTSFNPFLLGQSAIPKVAPYDSAAGAKTVENTVNAGGINQTNNITVSAQMNEEQVAAAVRTQVSAQAPDLLDRVARQLGDAMPRAERAAA